MLFLRPICVMMLLAAPANAGGDAVADPVADPAAEADRLAALMVSAFSGSDLTAALRFQEQVIALRRVLPDVERLADDLGDLATIRDRLGDDRGAADAWAESLPLFRSLGELECADRIVPRTSALAESERRLGNYRLAERHMRDAIDLSGRSAPSDFRHARLLNNLGALCWDQHRYDEASRLLREALTITEADPATTPDRLAVAIHNLANLEREQGKLDAAERRHRRALALAREHLAEDPRFPVFLKEPAVLLADLGRFEEADALWNEALAAAAGQDLLRSEIHWERGRAQLEAGRVVRARVELEQCLELREAALGQEHPAVGQALTGLAAARLGAGESADDELQRALAILGVTPAYPEEYAEAHLLRAGVAWERGEREAAIAGMGKALDLVEDLRLHRTTSEAGRVEWARRVADRTQRLVSWLVAENRVREALLASERIRARVLRDQMAAARVDWRRDLEGEDGAALAERERNARTRVASLRRELEAAYSDTAMQDASDQVTRLEEQLREAADELADVIERIREQSDTWSRALRAKEGADPIARAQLRLADDERVLIYQNGGEATFLFDVGRSDFACTELRVPEEVARAWTIPAGALAEATLERLLAAATPAPASSAGSASTRGIGRLRPSADSTSTSTRTLPRPVRDAARLADVLLPAGVRRRVLASRRVHIIPDGGLHGFPFETLVLSLDSDTVVPWIEVGPTVSYGHSITTWLEIEERDSACPPDAPIVSVVNPTFAAGGRWSPLPGTAAESDALQSSFPERGMIRLAGGDAREARLKEVAARACILHVGTHGIVEQQHAELSAALVLASEPADSPEDGFLHLFEIYELALHCEIVVLSACETKLGRRIRGEGIFALSRAFLAAGARRTVASLWRVDDDATSALMQEFFNAAAGNERQEGSPDWAAALREAKRRVRAREEWSDPFYWAGFVISGAMR